MKINYVGLNLLDRTEAESLKKLVSKYSSKFDNTVQNSSLKLHVKLHEIGGKTKYSFHVHLSFGRKAISVEHSEWDLKKTGHKVMEKLHNAVEHKLHIEGQKQQKFHPKKGKKGFGKSIAMRLKGLVKSI